MNETAFYVVGLALVALALIVSAVGLRMEKFPPSRGVMFGGVALFLGLVVATMAFGWLNAEDEQDHRNEEIAAGHEISPQEGLAEEAEAGAEEPPSETAEQEDPSTGAGEPTTALAEQGAQLYEELGCGGCHTLEAAASTGTTGPNLDGSLAGKDEEFIRTSIVDPNQEVGEDFQPNVMPQTYSELPPEEIDALVQFLVESAVKN